MASIYLVHIKSSGKSYPCGSIAAIFQHNLPVCIKVPTLYKHDFDVEPYENKCCTITKMELLKAKKPINTL